MTKFLFKKISLLTFFISCVLFTVGQTETQYPEGLKKGDKAPAFTLTDEKSKTFILTDAVKKNKVVIIFYRGQWCPYCNKQLSRLNDSLQILKDKGAIVIAITPETQENISKTISKTKAAFPVLYDSAMKVMQLYKVNFKMDDKTVEKYKGYGIDFGKANGSTGANLPVPATYIIGKDGVVQYVHFNTDYRKRPSVQEIMDNL